VKEDPSDNRILECAEAGGSEFIVTGDAQLLKLGQFAGMKILKPPEFLGLQIVTWTRALSARLVSLSLICGHGIPCRYLRGVVAILLKLCC